MAKNLNITLNFFKNMDNQQIKDPNNPSGPVKVKGKYKVWVDRSLCIGAATCVAVSACAVSNPLFTLQPALNPNQPTHSKPAPVNVITRLFGATAVFGCPLREPRNKAAIRPLIPEAI